MDNIAIVIPSVGRDSLLKAIESVKNQTVDNWIIYVGFDGNSIDIELNEKIKIFIFEKIGDAGITRNKILDKINEDYVLFLDDDDSLDPMAVELHSKYLISEKYDVVIPKSESIYRVLPRYNVVAQGNVGIWFSYNFKKFNLLRFNMGLLEDYKFLIKLYEKTKHIAWLNDILYIVGRKDKGEEDYSIRL